MNYFVTASIEVSKGQDRSDSYVNGLVVCDGIGSLPDSGIVAELVCKDLIHELDNINDFDDQLIVDKISAKVRELVGIGGTTLIYCREINEGVVRIGYLGNGGISAIRGDFFHEKMGDQVHLYTNLLLPHVDRSGALTRHISTNSSDKNTKLSTLDLNLNSECGDIILFFSDGLSSLETQFIADLDEKGIWRSETGFFQQILVSLHEFLAEHFHTDVPQWENTLYKLKSVLTNTIEKFKTAGILEDDLSIGVLVTGKVIEYYASKRIEA